MVQGGPRFPRTRATFDIGVKMKKALPAALGVLVLIIATACGGPKLSKSEQKISKTIATALSKPDDALLSKKEATCVADKFVGAVGEKKLKSTKAVTADDKYNSNGANADKKTSAAFTKALLDCTDEKDVQKAFSKTVSKAIGAASASGLSDKDVNCFSKEFVESAGVKGLLSTRVITDTGAMNLDSALPPQLDTKTATSYADALLGCVNYRKLLADQAAQSDKKIDATKLEACFKKDISDSDIKKLLVANQTQSADAAALQTDLTKKTDACTKEAKK